jgi:hypothetical protein
MVDLVPDQLEKAKAPEKGIAFSFFFKDELNGRTRNANDQMVLDTFVAEKQQRENGKTTT